MKYGLTTGTCAAAAAKGALLTLLTGAPPEEVSVAMPQRCSVLVRCFAGRADAGGAYWSVLKDGSDDPDITRGCEIGARVSFRDGAGIRITGGEGVGVVTKPGLQVPPGEHAINPVPRQMILANVQETLEARGEASRGVAVEIVVPEGRRLASKTFNPRLGIVGGLSILGTTGFVTPRSEEALRITFQLGLKVAQAQGFGECALVPGNIGRRAVLRNFTFVEDQVLEAGNYLGFMLGEASSLKALLLAGHPGKLAKILTGEYDTHSSRSASALPAVLAVARELGCRLEGFEAQTVEGLMEILSPGERERLATVLSGRIAGRIAADYRMNVEVALCDMGATILGATGGSERWRR